MAGDETLDVGAVFAAFKDVRIHIGLTVDEVRIIGGNAHLIRSPFSLSLEQPADVELEISAASLATFLEAKAPGGLSGFAVKLDGGKVFVDASMQVILSLPVSAVCTLRIDGGQRLFVDLESVNVMGAGPKSLVQKQLDSINPVFDLSELPLDGRLDSVEVAGGKVLLKGKVAPKSEQSR